MDSKAVKIVVIDGKTIEKTVEIQPGAGKPVILDAVENGKYLLAEDGTGVAPENITTKRVGDDLYISLEGADTDQPQIIIEDYYLKDGDLVGKSEDGLYYSYVTAYGEQSAALPADVAEPLALGDDALTDFADGLIADESNDNLMWVLAGLGLLALAGGAAAIAHNNNDDDDHHSSNASADTGGNSGGDNGGGGGNNATVNAGTLDAITDDVGSVTGPIADGGATDDNKPTLSGSGVAPGNIVVITDSDGSEIGSTTAGADGTWSYTPDSPLTDGEHSLSVVVVDGDGNKSAPSNAITVVVDTVAPGPAEAKATDDAGNIIDGPTGDSTPEISGKAEPGSTVVITDGGKEIGTTTVDENGDWSFTPDTPLADGDHDIGVVVVDDAGNTSPATDIPISVDTTAPDAPTANVTDKEGNIIPADKPTNNNTPTISGDAEPGSKVVITDGDKEIGTAIVDENGSWSFTPDTPLADGDHDISAEVVDDAGNTSPATDIPISVDTQDPEPAGSMKLIDDVGDINGEIKSGDTTDDTQPTSTGTAEVGSTVIISDNGEVIGSVAVSDDGSWAFTPDQPLKEGSHSFSSVVVDDAGNQSQPSPAIDFTVEVPVPAPIPEVSGSENFESDTAHVFKTAGESVALDSGLTVTFVKGPTDGSGNNSYTEISNKGIGLFAPEAFGTQALMLVENSETHIDFNGGTSAVSFDVNASSFAGSFVNYYDTSGELLYQQEFPIQTETSELKTLAWEAPEGTLIGSISFLMTSGVGNNVITRVDNFKWGTEADTGVAEANQPVAAAQDYDAHVAVLDYAAVAQESHQGTLAIQGDAHLTLDQLLVEAKQDLFIDDGQQQVAITGDEGSTVSIDLADESQSWEQSGQVTAGGVQYDVYQQQDSSLELLVQHGVELSHG